MASGVPVATGTAVDCGAGLWVCPGSGVASGVVPVLPAGVAWGCRAVAPGVGGWALVAAGARVVPVLAVAAWVLAARGSPRSGPAGVSPPPHAKVAAATASRTIRTVKD